MTSEDDSKTSPSGSPPNEPTSTTTTTTLPSETLQLARNQDERDLLSLFVADRGVAWVTKHGAFVLAEARALNEV